MAVSALVACLFATPLAYLAIRGLNGEDLIDVMQARKAWADSISGSLRFTAGGTDSEITMARLIRRAAVASRSRPMFTAIHRRAALRPDSTHGIQRESFAW